MKKLSLIILILALFAIESSGQDVQTVGEKNLPLKRYHSKLAERKALAPPPTPHKEETFEQRPGEPPRKKMPKGDAARDASGRGQMFESISIPGVTDFQQGMNGFALADMNHDGRIDIIAAYSPVRGTARDTGSSHKLRVFLNQGDFHFKSHKLTFRNTELKMDSIMRGEVPNLADFNNDGHLDLFITRNALMAGGKKRPNQKLPGNTLLVSEGSWDQFRDVSTDMGIRNRKAYNRQPSFGDVNQDGWLDIAVGCDNIKNANGGFPHSRLYVFQPKGKSFNKGTFKDIGGTDLVPDYGGFYHDSDKDKAGPDINLVDLDNDGDLDLVQAVHVDVMDLDAPYSAIEYRQGVFCWKNMHNEIGSLRYEKIINNGLACEARLRYNPKTKTVKPEGRAPGLPYVSFADTDNDGDMDVLAVGPGSPNWAPRTEYIGGRFWRNLGDFKFEVATDTAGLTPLTWNYGKWMAFFDAPIPKKTRGRIKPKNRFPYYSDALFGDFNNDGWIDLIVPDRNESPIFATRAALFMNRGDGTFELKPTTFSGLDDGGISGEVADLNNDGLLDLVLANDPDNTGVSKSMAMYESRIYWNTGQHGGRDNHWLRMRFSGISDAELIGARVEARQPGKKKLVGTRWIHSNHAYKSGSALVAHFGLGKLDSVDVTVILPNGKRCRFPSLKPDRFLDLNLNTNKKITVKDAK